MRKKSWKVKQWEVLTQLKIEIDWWRKHIEVRKYTPKWDLWYNLESEIKTSYVFLVSNNFAKWEEKEKEWEKYVDG
jgi:hypothetical protein